MKFYSFDLDINPMTLVLKLNLYVKKMYVCTKNEGPTFSSSKVIIWADRQTRLKLLPTTYAYGKNLPKKRVKLYSSFSVITQSWKCWQIWHYWVLVSDMSGCLFSMFSREPSLLYNVLHFDWNVQNSIMKYSFPDWK